MKRLPAVVVLVVATMCVGTSRAQRADTSEPPHRDSQSRFDRLDVDDDGELARDELFMIASARFDQLDTNEDGVLDVDEFRSILDGRDPEIRFRALDVDGDGRIHRDELPEDLRARFEWLDTNGNDVVDENEVQRLALSEREARNGPGGPLSQLRLMRRLMELDLDNDGRLHRDELPEAMEFLIRNFSELDSDDDGYIDGAELRAMTEQTRRRRRYQPD